TDLVYPTAFRDPNADELSRLRKRIAELEHTVRVLTQRGSPEGGLDPGIMQAITGRVMSPAEGDESTRKKGRRDPPAGADARIQSSSSNHSGGPNAASNPSSFSTGTGIRIPGADSSAQASYTFTSPRGSPGSAVPMTTGSSCVAYLLDYLDTRPRKVDQRLGNPFTAVVLCLTTAEPC
ncbi:hypothetical protein FRB97_005990, partial [Tulasnella sp. 331]